MKLSEAVLLFVVIMLAIAIAIALVLYAEGIAQNSGGGAFVPIGAALAIIIGSAIAAKFGPR